AVSARPWYADYARNQPEAEPQGGGLENAAAARDKPSPLDMAYAITFYPSTTDENAATAVTLEAADRFSADMSLTAVPAVRLRISDPGAGPNQGFNASARQWFFGELPLTVPLQGVGVSDGQVDISGLAPGQYEVELQTEGQGAAWRQQVSLA